MLTFLKQYRIVPVAVFRDVERVEPYLSALERGGLPLAEITFRTDCAEEAIQIASKRFTNFLIGAGTVINGRQCEKALRAGAKFIVSPGLSEEVAAVCAEAGILYLPGSATATEMMRALALGLDHLKFFPAEALGGLAMLRALGAAFPQVEFLPTGGIGISNLKEYLRRPNVFACGGSWMFEGTPEETENKVREAVALAKEEEKNESRHTR